MNSKPPFISAAIPMLALLLLAANSVFAAEQTPFLKAEPEPDSVQARAPRTLRLYFQALPDVERSEVILTGPTGELNLRGLHTMGADDLMMEIYDDVVNGSYTVEWRTYIGDDPALYSGTFSFTVQAD